MESREVLKIIADYFDKIHFLNTQHEVIKEVFLLISKLFEPEFLIFLPLKNNPNKIVYEFYPDKEQFIQREKGVKLDSRIILEVIRNKEVLIYRSEEIKKEELFDENIIFSKILILPFSLKGSVFGILFIGKKDFSNEEISNLKALSIIFSRIISEVNVMGILNKLISDLKISYEISKVMIEEMDTERFIMRLFEEIRNKFGYEIIAIFLLSKDRKFAILEYTVEEHRDMKGFKFSLDKKSIINYVVHSGLPYYCADTSKDPNYYAGIDGVKSEFVVPLKIKDKMIGVIDIESKKIDDFPETTRNLIESFAALIAISIENKRLFEETRRLSRLDSLTGLLNRRTLEEEIEKTIERCNHEKNNFCLFFIDIDNFKKFNDKYGHLKGDMVLKKFGSIFIKFKNGICGRYGGDEFVCGFIFDDKNDVKEKAMKIINNVRKIKGLKSLGVSIGISFLNVDGKTLDELISSADKKCYAAKRQGGNRFKI